LLLYTDGLLEASNAAGENFSERLEERIAVYRHLSASAFADALMADLRAWTPRSGVHLQEDDVTLIVVDVQEAASLSAAPTGALHSGRV
jgi:serine phosphatase RsbU (regulator of sigma subunit)